MSPADETRGEADLPPGCAAVALPGQDEAPLRIAVLVRREADAAGPLVVLRRNLDSVAYLGCVVDRGERVHTWVEIWVQTLAGLADTPAACREALTNAILDERWQAFAAALARQPGGALLRTGWESAPPPPLYLDAARGAAVAPADPASGSPWRLCRDDVLLTANGLPPYSTTLHRYWVAQAEGQPARFTPATPGAPESPATLPPKAALGALGALTPFCPEGGLLLVMPYSPLSFEEFLDVAGGGAWEGIHHGRGLVDPGGVGSVLATPSNPRSVLLGARGRSGRLTEAFYLKTAFLADLFARVQAVVKSQQRPFLSLDSAAVRARVAEGGIGLPLLWSTAPALATAGDAIVLPVETSDARYFLQPHTGLSIFRPAIGLGVRGRGAVRIRQTLPEGRGGIVVEGTFQTQEPIANNPHDLTWLRLGLGGRIVDLYATLTEDRALALGEWRFRTVAQTLGEEAVRDLKAAEGVPVPGVPFEVIPLLSTPCDLYALAILSIQALLVDRKTTLPKALDELISLAREAGRGPAGTPLGRRIAELFVRDARWPAAVGPQRLVQEELTPEEAWQAIPQPLWCDALAMVARMLPGLTPDSTCKDYGDVAGGLHEVFAVAVADATSLVARARNLIITDWTFNREAREVVAALG